jgi:phage terminase large subunit GpA-like protein
MTNPMDMIIYNPSHAAARDFSIRRVDRLHRNSPDVGKRLSPRRDNDNRRDKLYRNGMLLSLSWPSVTEFAGKPIGRVALTDFDRMDDDIEGDGNPYDLASKRTTTFESYAMTLAESSPSREVLDPNWIPKTPHEAPPCLGILGLYNRGDRRRWYWPCVNCGQYFEGQFRHLEWNSEIQNHAEAAATVRMICPHCAYHIEPRHRAEMQSWGQWVKDGQRITKTGRVVGRAVKSDIASFWLNGTAAAFVTWPKLVLMYLTADADYQRTGSEDALRKFYNNDCAQPYISKAKETRRLPEVLKNRAERRPERSVPHEVRSLIATVDVQKNMFVVAVYGIAPGDIPGQFDLHVVDFFDVRKSRRKDADDDSIWVKPGTYLEDWDELIEHVISKEYPLEVDPGKRMQIKLTLCDSGGREGVTTNAYAFYRKLRKDGLHRRFHLVKGFSPGVAEVRGDSSAGTPRAFLRYPDSNTRSSGVKAGAQGDIPVLFINSLAVKDALANRLESSDPGKNMVHFPDWLPDRFYKELCGEIRTPKGWEPAKGGRARNEAWDLTYYMLGACFSSLLDIERVDWSKPPSWLDVPSKNPLVVGEGEDVVAKSKPMFDFAALGKALA